MVMRTRCELMYHMHMSLSDINKTTLTELEYYYGWLSNELNKDKEEKDG